MPRQIGKSNSISMMENYEIQILRYFHNMMQARNTIFLFCIRTYFYDEYIKKPYDNGNKFRRQNDCNLYLMIRNSQRINALCPSNLSKRKTINDRNNRSYRGQVENLENKEEEDIQIS